MRSIKPLIAGNGIAIFLTIVCLLPITAIFALAASAPLDGAMANFGLFLHGIFNWSTTEFDTVARFSKIVKEKVNELFMGGGWMATSGNLDNPPKTILDSDRDVAR